MHMKALKRGLPPMHPGELLADVLPATGKTITEVADLIGISRQMLSMIVNGHARVTPDVAALLGSAMAPACGYVCRLTGMLSTSIRQSEPRSSAFGRWKPSLSGC